MNGRAGCGELRESKGRTASTTFGCSNTISNFEGGYGTSGTDHLGLRLEPPTDEGLKRSIQKAFAAASSFQPATGGNTIGVTSKIRLRTHQLPPYHLPPLLAKRVHSSLSQTTSDASRAAAPADKGRAGLCGGGSADGWSASESVEREIMEVAGDATAFESEMARARSVRKRVVVVVHDTAC
ncbi:hypothetical protein EI94DRAFT_1705195 [Lactarius quietus]|nr:hypothetical protein EI94DRAFT_1705195 [Lactarius quietus]